MLCKENCYFSGVALSGGKNHCAISKQKYITQYKEDDGTHHNIDLSISYHHLELMKKVGFRIIIGDWPCKLIKLITFNYRYGLNVFINGIMATAHIDTAMFNHGSVIYLSSRFVDNNSGNLEMAQQNQSHGFRSGKIRRIKIVYGSGPSEIPMGHYIMDNIDFEECDLFRAHPNSKSPINNFIDCVLPESFVRYMGECTNTFFLMK